MEQGRKQKREQEQKQVQEQEQKQVQEQEQKQEQTQRQEIHLEGTWEAVLPIEGETKEATYTVKLPGTLDEYGIVIIH